MSILNRFKYFLIMKESSLRTMVDLYNAGRLSPESRLALEAIEAMIDEDIKKET